MSESGLNHSFSDSKLLSLLTNSKWVNGPVNASFLKGRWLRRMEIIGTLILLIMFIMAYFQKFGLFSKIWLWAYVKELCDAQDSHIITKNDLNKSNHFFLTFLMILPLTTYSISILLSKKGNWHTEFSNISGKSLYKYY